MQESPTAQSDSLVRQPTPTAADILVNWPNINTDFAGLSKDAEDRVTEELIAWADVIFVMEARQKKRLRTVLGSPVSGRWLISLNIPDKFDAHDPELVNLIVQKMEPYFGPCPQRDP